MKAQDAATIKGLRGQVSGLERGDADVVSTAKGALSSEIKSLEGVREWGVFPL